MFIVNRLCKISHKLHFFGLDSMINYGIFNVHKYVRSVWSFVYVVLVPYVRLSLRGNLFPPA